MRRNLVLHVRGPLALRWCQPTRALCQNKRRRVHPTPSYNAQTAHNLPSGAYSIPDSLGHDCADLIRQFLVVDPSRRITISQAWHHPWLSSVNAGAHLCDLDDDDVNAEAAMLASLGLYEGPASGAADPEDPARIECCSTKCGLPEELLASALLRSRIWLTGTIFLSFRTGLKYTDGWASLSVTVAALAAAGEEKPDPSGKKRSLSITSKPPLAASTGASAPPSAAAAVLVPVDERTVTLLLRDPASVQLPPSSL